MSGLCTSLMDRKNDRRTKYNASMFCLSHEGIVTLRYYRVHGFLPAADYRHH